jgi:co-chaperonin GroES (HSP10)
MARGNKNTITADAFHPIRDKVFVSDLDSGPRETAAGIIIPDDNMSERGVHPRWGRVWAIGPDVKDIEVGEWVYIEHARWTNSIDLDLPEGLVRIWQVEWPASVMLATAEDPRANQPAQLREVSHPKSSHHIIRSKAPIIKRFHH